MIDTEALRKKVIDLAIQGKLTEQLPSDGDAETLYAQIQKEKKRQIQKGLLRKTRGFNAITEDIIPFSFPDQWQICYIDDIAFVTKLAGFEYTKYIADSICDEGIPLFKGKNIQKGELVLEFESYIPQSVSDELPRSKVCKKCLLTPYVGTIGNIALFNGVFDAHLGSNVGKIEIINPSSTCLMEEYLLYYLRSSIGYSELTKHKKATAQDSISIDAIRNVIISIPPIEEQKRIVDKIDVVLTQLDIIDELQAKYSNDLSVLKSKIIDAGIQGKLTEQLSEDGDAETLYAQIQEEKAKLIKDGKIKKEKTYPEITADEIPFEIPKSWKWVHIGDVTYNHGQKTPESRFCYIDVGTLDNVNHKLNENENIVEAKNAPSRAKKIVETGDVLYSTVRPYLHNICVVDKEFSYEPIASTAFAVMHMFNDTILNKYIYYWLLSECFDRFANGNNSKGTLYPAIGERSFFNGIISLPPRKEQERIATIIERVLAIALQ